MIKNTESLRMSDHDLLLRIDERTENLQKTVDSIKLNIRLNYVDLREFYPIKKVVYGLVGATLTTMFLGLISLILKL